MAFAAFFGCTALCLRLLPFCLPRAFCGHSCSVLLSALFCLRHFFLCYLCLGALLSSIPFSFRDGCPDISYGPMARAFFSFRCPHRYFRLGCSYPLYRFADAPAGNGGISSSCYTDLVTTLYERCCASLLALPGICCMSTSPMLYANKPSTLYLHCVPVSTLRQKIYFRLCAYCRHYTIVFVRTSYKHDKMWLVGLRVLPWMHLPVSRPCRPCIATAAAPQRADECILCRLSPHLHVSIDPPWTQKPALIHSLHSLHCLSSRYFARSALQSNFSPPQNRNSNSHPTFAPFWNGAAGKGLYTNKPCLSWTRVNAMYGVSGSPVSPMCMSMTTPSLQVCPWALWAVVANPGANGNCFRVPRSTGRLRPLSKYHGFFCGATGKTLSSSIPWTPLKPDQDARRQLVPNLRRLLTRPPDGIRGQTQPTISPAHPRKIPRLRSKWSAAATGIPMHSGKTRYKDPQSWSCCCSHVNFSLPRSGFSRKAALDILSFAMAWCSTCPVSAAQALARSLFTWYFTAFVAKIAFARANFAEAAGGGELMAVGCGRRRGRRHPGASPFYMFMGKANHCRDHSSGVGGKQEPL